MNIFALVTLIREIVHSANHLNVACEGENCFRETENAYATLYRNESKSIFYESWQIKRLQIEKKKGHVFHFFKEKTSKEHSRIFFPTYYNNFFNF